MFYVFQRIYPVKVNFVKTLCRGKTKSLPSKNSYLCSPPLKTVEQIEQGSNSMITKEKTCSKNIFVLFVKLEHGSVLSFLRNFGDAKSISLYRETLNSRLALARSRRRITGFKTPRRKKTPLGKLPSRVRSYTFQTLSKALIASLSFLASAVSSPRL